MNQDAAGKGTRTESQVAAIAAADLLGSPACLLDHDGCIVHLNAAWASFAGAIDPDASAHWTQLVHPAHRDGAATRLRATLAAGAHAEFECRLDATSGAPRSFIASFHPVDRDGACWLCIAVDAQPFKHREMELEARESVLEDMLDASVDCIKVIDLDGHLLRINKAGAGALGVAARPPAGTRWLSLLPAEVREEGAEALAAAIAGRSGRFPARSIVAGQPEQCWDNLLTPVLDAQGRPVAVVCVSREVTAERRALEQLRQSEERLAIAARVGGLGLWDYDIPGDRLFCDESWYRIMGRDVRNPVRSIDDFRPFIHPDDVERATEVQRTAAELIASRRDYSITFRILRADGEVRWIRSLGCVQHSDGIPVRATGFVADVTEALHGELALRDANRALEDERESLARKVLEDPLTGIANRRHLDDELARACSRADASREPLCTGMVDVDRFKQFNDRYGHLEGDAALRRLAAALQAVAGQTAFVARYGGEEFAFVLPGTGDPAPFLDEIAAAIAALRIPHADSPTGFLTASCGAVVARGELSPRRLLGLGDEALYQAKTGGRNRYVIRIVEPEPRSGSDTPAA